MLTFREYGSQVLDLREREGVRGIVSERNRWDVHVSSAPFADVSLTDIRGTMIRDWLRAMQAKSAQDSRGDRLLSTQTVARAKALVSAIMARAVEDELLEANVCRDVKLRKRAEEMTADEPWTFLTLPEQRAFATCEAIDPWHRVAIRFAAGTGLRQGEQFNLELRDVHVDGPAPHVFVRYGSKGKPPKNGKCRKVPLFGDGLLAAREALDFLSDVPNPDGLLFPSKDGARRGVGKPLGIGKDEDGVWCDVWKLAKRRAGITRRLRWHDLRHTCASNLVSGVLGRRWTLEEIRPLMGHSSITITMRYAHLGEDALAACARETTGVMLVPPAADTVRDLAHAAE
jgi:integrase